MAPSLSHGDYLIISKARILRPGFIVLVEHPKYGMIVKRVIAVTDAAVKLSGDNPDSTSSEALGLISLDKVIGRARLAITPEGMKRL